ncbi:MAG: alkaline phosphatase PhoX [Bacteroidia bacterium]
MYKRLLSILPITVVLLVFAACKNDDTPKVPGNTVSLESHSKTPVFFEIRPEFSEIEIYNLLSSEDQLTESPDFVYGSMADGAGLIRSDDSTFTLINNIEADFSIARITFDKTFKPVKGEHILNANGTAYTAQCSGTLITPSEHGFGPLYLSGGEWGGASKGVFATDPFRSVNEASIPKMLTAMGQWSVENAVPIGKDAYADKTVVFIGDDDSDDNVPSGQLGMYVGDRGDLEGGKLYGLKVADAGIIYEMDMEEGSSYKAEWVELEELERALLDAECKSKGVMGFSRLEDIDWRRGSASNQREVYMAVTGRNKDGLIGKGTLYGRVYKIVLNENDPTGIATITCVLDGDKLNGKARALYSPDNILVTENYAYIQEDPNGYSFMPGKAHYASLYQYNLNTGEFKTVLSCDQSAATTQGYGNRSSTWEITGMIDVSDIINVDNTYLMITQNHGWVPADGSSFTDPLANPASNARKEGSMLYVVKGLQR